MSDKLKKSKQHSIYNLLEGKKRDLSKIKVSPSEDVPIIKKPEKKGTLNPKSINSNTPMVNSSGQIVGYGPEKKMGGGKVKGYKKGGPITYRMTGGQVVGNSYD
tara:strand:+ start:1399 stop:1710 length:312 start_codon:yes stop_codon:yes gene_type:complete